MADSFENWVPQKLKTEADTPMLQWLFTGKLPFDAPFFDDTILSCIRSFSENQSLQKRTTPLEQLVNLRPEQFIPQPAGIILHVSRCGSTLLSQLLTLKKEHLVLSEVPVLDELLRLPLKHSNISPSLAQQYFMQALYWHSQIRTGEEKLLFIKADAWHLFFYQQLRALFPNTPFLLLYRKPQEVLKSHQRLRGMHMVPLQIEPKLSGLNMTETLETNLDAYTIAMLEKYYEAMAEIAATDTKSRLLNFEAGAMAMMRQLAQFCQLPFDEKWQQAIAIRSQFNAKLPNQSFEEENNSEVENLPGMLGCVNAYEKLEYLRTQQP